MKYQIIYADAAEELSSKVTEGLENGWQLYGDPFVSSQFDYNYYCQAMVLNEPPPGVKAEFARMDIRMPAFDEQLMNVGPA